MSTRPGAFLRLTLAAAAATLVLIALGGVVRITGSGMGCGDHWPLCRGRLLPPLDPPTLIEYSHRLAASVVSVLVLALGVLGWTRHRREPRLRRPATLAVALLVTQVLLGAAAVRLGLPAGSVVLHLTAAMLLLATLAVAALRTGEPRAAAPLPAATAVSTGGARSAARPASAERLPESAGTTGGAGAGYAALARACAVLGFGVVVMGALVANLNAGSACRGFPLCDGELLPQGGTQVTLHWLHRLLAFLLLGLLGAAFVGARRLRPRSERLRSLSAAALGLALLQVGIAAAMVVGSFPPGLRAAHLTVGALVWVSLVALDHHAHRRASLPQPTGMPTAAARPRRGRELPHAGDEMTAGCRNEDAGIELETR